MIFTSSRQMVILDDYHFLGIRHLLILHFFTEGGSAGLSALLRARYYP